MTEQFNKGALKRQGATAARVNVNRDEISMDHRYWTVPEARELRDWLDTVIPKETHG